MEYICEGGELDMFLLVVVCVILTTQNKQLNATS